jgi:D-aminopeptidase
VFADGHAWAMPVVAETYDGITNDICGLHVREEHALAALDSAAGGPVREGNVGGGTGMICYGFKGGTGTSSRRVEAGGRAYTLGALVQANFGKRQDLTVLGAPVGRHMPEDAVRAALLQREAGSIVAVLATDAPLSPRQLERIARRATLGAGRTGTTGGHYSGDLFLAFSTANRRPWRGMAASQPATFPLEQLNDHHCDVLYRAAVQAVEESVVNALLAAEPMTTVKPAGYTVDAIDPRRLMAVLRSHGGCAAGAAGDEGGS